MNITVKLSMCLKQFMCVKLHSNNKKNIFQLMQYEFDTWEIIMFLNTYQAFFLLCYCAQDAKYLTLFN